jgi:RNA polymerase sigma-70 factor (ECF subfamily)
MARVEEVLERLYRERYAGFRNAIVPVVGSREAAHDVVQEAFARALRDARKLRRHESAAAWVWQIALNVALRERQRSSLEELPEDLTIAEPERDPDLAAAIQTLPPRRRLIVFLRYYADFSYAEIAEAMEVAPGTVAATIAQAHAALLDLLLTKEMARDHGR